jgi:hypothetical protein
MHCDDGHVTNHAPENTCPQCGTISEGADERIIACAMLVPWHHSSPMRFNRYVCSTGELPPLSVPQSDTGSHVLTQPPPQNQRLVGGCTGIASRDGTVLSLTPAE